MKLKFLGRAAVNQYIVVQLEHSAQKYSKAKCSVGFNFFLSFHLILKICRNESLEG